MAKYPLMRSNILREDLDAVIAHLQGDDPILTNGPQCAAFEREWSEWLGVKHSVFVNAGASANLLSIAVLKIRHPEGGEVIVPPLTWVSDIATVLQNGFNPVFADIDPARWRGPGSITPDHRLRRRLPHPLHASRRDTRCCRLGAALLSRDVFESHGSTLATEASASADFELQFY